MRSNKEEFLAKIRKLDREMNEEGGKINISTKNSLLGSPIQGKCFS